MHASLSFFFSIFALALTYSANRTLSSWTMCLLEFSALKTTRNSQIDVMVSMVEDQFTPFYPFHLSNSTPVIKIHVLQKASLGHLVVLTRSACFQDPEQWLVCPLLLIAVAGRDAPTCRSIGDKRTRTKPKTERQMCVWYVLLVSFENRSFISVCECGEE